MPKKSIATEIVDLFIQEGVMTFKDQYQEAYALLPERNCHGVSLRSRAFRQWIAKFAYDNMKRVPGSEVIKSVCTTLEGKASSSASIPLHIRVGMFDSIIYYDLGNGEFAEISSKGWEIVDTSPIWFRPLSHQKYQVKPARNGNVYDLFKFVNLSEESKGAGRDTLLLVWIVAAFVPDFPHPVLVVHGPHGSAKSTLFTLIKNLIDPSALTKLAPASCINDFVVSALRHWFLPLDNLSVLPEWMSDSICRACTGDGISKRELYTDCDEVIFNFRRIIGINGISLVVDRPDLLDRAILLELTAITKDNRRSETEFMEEFENNKPSILGAIFDILSGALREISNVHLKDMPRMADFIRWGIAISRAMGLPDEALLNAYEENVQNQHEEAISASPIAQAVIELMKGRTFLESTPSDLLTDLNRIARDLSIDTKMKIWPRDSNWLWRRLIVVRNNLQAIGVEIERLGRGRSRFIRIRNNDQNGVNAVDVVKGLLENTTA